MKNCHCIHKGMSRKFRHLLVVIMLGTIISISPFIGYAAESASVAVVDVPLVMSGTVLPTQMIVVENPVVKEQSMTIVGCGSDGAVLLIRVSSHD